MVHFFTSYGGETVHEGEKKTTIPNIVENDSAKPFLQNFNNLKWFIFPQKGEQAGPADQHKHLTST